MINKEWTETMFKHVWNKNNDKTLSDKTIFKELCKNVVNYVIKLRKNGCPDNTMYSMIIKKYKIDSVLARQLKLKAYGILNKKKEKEKKE